MIHQGLLYRNGDGEVGDGEVVVGRQVLLRLCGYISVCPTLQLSHSGVPGVGLGWVLEPGGPESFPLVRPGPLITPRLLLSSTRHTYWTRAGGEVGHWAARK